MMSEDKATQESVSLYDADRAIVQKAMEKAHTVSFSRGLQFLIRDWQNLSDILSRFGAQPQPDSPAPQKGRK